MSLLSTFFKFREKSDGDIVKPFLEHMEDLRWTLIKVVSTLAVATGIAFLFVGNITAMLMAPKPPDIKIVTTGVTNRCSPPSNWRSSAGS